MFLTKKESYQTVNPILIRLQAFKEVLIKTTKQSKMKSWPKGISCGLNGRLKQGHLDTLILTHRLCRCILLIYLPKTCIQDPMPIKG